jgi:hypothetical protein
LIPTGDSLIELGRDYAQMRAANMILGDVPDFADIIDRLGRLADSINQLQ